MQIFSELVLTYLLRAFPSSEKVNLSKYLGVNIKGIRLENVHPNLLVKQIIRKYFQDKKKRTIVNNHLKKIAIKEINNPMVLNITFDELYLNDKFINILLGLLQDNRNEYHLKGIKILNELEESLKENKLKNKISYNYSDGEKSYSSDELIKINNELNEKLSYKENVNNEQQELILKLRNQIEDIKSMIDNKNKELADMSLKINSLKKQYNKKNSDLSLKNKELLLRVKDLKTKIQGHEEFDLINKENHLLKRELRKKEFEVKELSEVINTLENRIKINEIKELERMKIFEKEDSSSEDISNYLAGKIIGLIGGQENLVSKYNDLMEKNSAHMERTSGFKGLSGKIIESIVSKSDFVIFFTDTNSHKAYSQLIKSSKKLNKQYFILNNSGLGSLNEFLKDFFDK